MTDQPPAYSTLARLQQALTLWALACALTWGVWVWPHSPALAIAGFLVFTLGFAPVLALEFALLPGVARSDPVPVAGAGQMLQAWAREVALVLQIYTWRQPFRWRAVSDRLAGEGVAGRHGVVLVHGFVCNRGFWTPWLKGLQVDGRAVVAVNLEPVFGPIDGYAALVQDAVERVRQATGLPPVLVCHSMGGLVARAWLRTREDGPQAVAHVVTIGSPHAGTWMARFSQAANGRQMRLDSGWLKDLYEAWTPALAARFTCWYSNCDNIVMPPSTATLPGADNRLLAGAAHIDLAFRPQVMRHARELLESLDRQA